MFCQRGKVATLVPPNFITIQGAPAESGAEAFEVTMSLSGLRGTQFTQCCAASAGMQPPIVTMDGHLDG
jgi:hypothetical protein